ncbi:hypothetical protein ARMGADRAFT_940134 [Armillaria gallica]|uniref:DNA breaking-rejoining enzyme n=1 Tax=Armillaria gallica TaxID=47427 RepID=A0A2H3CUD9_ARMGA|nr:hypothetical protein ARMGADRAFT_940134 [Armillaria gallica]
MDPSISAEDRNYLDVIRDASKGVKEGTNDAYQGCDDCDMHGVDKAPHVVQNSYSYAQKLWAGATFGFRTAGGRERAWNRENASGNPSISQLVSCYMLGLQKHKVAKGETSMSARAISPDDLLKLYEFNRRAENWDNAKVSANNWCGANMRRLLEAVYLVAFTCLLRIDEALKIQLHDLHFYDDPVDGTACVSVTLPFRKNSPYGKILPFILRELPDDMAHLCPVRALAEWVGTSEILHGYLFRRMDKRDRPIVAKNTHMTAEAFLELFRNNLCDLEIAPYAYGTHSFRREGCQWLSVDLRWSLRQICEWGGWSSDFSHLTIVKYLISWNDNPMLRRDDFFKLDCQLLVQCRTCGRTCPCA